MPSLPGCESFLALCGNAVYTLPTRQPLGGRLGDRIHCCAITVLVFNSSSLHCCNCSISLLVSVVSLFLCLIYKWNFIIAVYVYNKTEYNRVLYYLWFQASAGGLGVYSCGYRVGQGYIYLYINSRLEFILISVSFCVIATVRRWYLFLSYEYKDSENRWKSNLFILMHEYDRRQKTDVK